MTEDDLVDEAALERAARGDRGVWASLTDTERRLAMVAAHQRRHAELAENDEWKQVRTTLLGRAVTAPSKGEPPFLPHAGRNQTPEWLAEIVEAAGYRTVETFMRAARRMARES